MKMLIVDDEVQIRTGIQECVDWARQGIEEVFVAENGHEALRLCEQHQPEVIITDVLMPQMNGLEFIQALRGNSQHCKIIVMSGYSEFEYAKQAVKYGVMEYELKPVNVRKLTGLVRRAIDEYKEERKHISSYYRYWQNQLFRELKENEFQEQSEFYDLLRTKLDWENGQRLQICSVQIDGSLDRANGMVPRLLNSFVTEAMEAIPAIAHEENVGRSYFMIVSPESHDWSPEHWWKGFNDNLSTTLKATVSMGVSLIGGISELNQMYEQAGRALELKLYKGKQSFTHMQELGSRTCRNGPDHHKDPESVIPEEAIIRALDDPDGHTVEELVQDLFSQLNQKRKWGYRGVQAITTQLLKIAARKIQRVAGMEAAMATHPLLTQSDLTGHETLDAYEGHVLKAYHQVHQYLHGSQDFSYSPSIARAILYIKRHYKRDITVRDVSSHVEQSPNYFSHRFKQEVDIGFSQFVTRQRIEAAKDLMKTSTMLISHIGWEVGFRDHKYFTQVFKKYEGLPPSEYQKRLLSSGDVPNDMIKSGAQAMGTDMP